MNNRPNVVVPSRANGFPRPCSKCGSYAINPDMHGRGSDNLDLCDVCYWRARHEALAEAVAWMLECDACPLRNKTAAEKHGFSELWATRRAARSEVDRLIENESPADCKGEG